MTSWEDVTIGDAKRFCKGCNFDPFNYLDRNRISAYSRRGTYAFLRRAITGIVHFFHSLKYSKMPRTHKIKTDVLAAALKEYDGNYEKVAEHFGTTAKKIRERVYHDPQLYSVWVKNGVKEMKPDGIELMERQHEFDDEKGTRLLEALDKNSRYVFNNDLSKAFLQIKTM